jgi:hypothetical protein
VVRVQTLANLQYVKYQGAIGISNKIVEEDGLHQLKWCIFYKCDEMLNIFKEKGRLEQRK